jgi:hypothetical protein
MSYIPSFHFTVTTAAVLRTLVNCISGTQESGRKKQRLICHEFIRSYRAEEGKKGVFTERKQESPYSGSPLNIIAPTIPVISGFQRPCLYVAHMFAILLV